MTSLGQMDRLWTTDTRALNHILTHSTQYQKPEAARRNVAKLLGEGVLFTEGEGSRAVHADNRQADVRTRSRTAQTTGTSDNTFHFARI